MQKSDSIKNVMTALGLFQAKAIKIRKDSINPHFKSKYASLSVILDEIQPMLTECKLVFTQVPEESTHLITMLFHTESGEYLESRYELKAAQTTPQGLGSAITYARRYSLTSILGLNIDDDDDGNEASKQPESKKTNATPQAQQQPAPNTQTPPQQQAPAPVQTPYNKLYNDVNAIIAVVKSAAKVDELTQLYFTNKDFIEKNSSIKDAISSRRDAINNQGKVIITDGQYAKVCERIKKGDATVLENAIKNYILKPGQIEELQFLDNQRRQLEEALSFKYQNPSDIATLIDACTTPEYINRLHKNNSMIIDRDPELTNKINGKIKTLKQAA